MVLFHWDKGLLWIRIWSPTLVGRKVKYGLKKKYGWDQKTFCDNENCKIGLRAKKKRPGSGVSLSFSLLHYCPVFMGSNNHYQWAGGPNTKIDKHHQMKIKDLQPIKQFKTVHYKLVYNHLRCPQNKNVNEYWVVSGHSYWQALY